ncbi:hypothetical protein GCM10025876_16360 [Demequina litorisediminis]|uniref:Uncharacterized protein n=1 Tax=Demequina litorisediminis TaxID=1849022 RepID=A0ABQ6IE37_9MICO|nr:hypothetical protein GCM10025876_16360 [Demequina litorisediminis]
MGTLGMNLMSSTLVEGGSGEPLGVIQSRQIDAYREAWAEAGHPGTPRVSISRSIMPIIDDTTAAYFGTTMERDRMGANRDQVGQIDNFVATFGKTYVGDLDKIEAEPTQGRGCPVGRHGPRDDPQSTGSRLQPHHVRRLHRTAVAPGRGSYGTRAGIGHPSLGPGLER